MATYIVSYLDFEERVVVQLTNTCHRGILKGPILVQYLPVAISSVARRQDPLLPLGPLFYQFDHVSS